jgi:capsid portal protein
MQFRTLRKNIGTPRKCSFGCPRFLGAVQPRLAAEQAEKLRPHWTTRE